MLILAVYSQDDQMVHQITASNYHPKYKLNILKRQVFVSILNPFVQRHRQPSISFKKSDLRGSPEGTLPWMLSKAHQSEGSGTSAKYTKQFLIRFSKLFGLEYFDSVRIKYSGR